MNIGFYTKLAASNIKKNGKTYLPYILACIGTIAVYYIMCFLSANEGLDYIKGSAQLKTILFLGCIVIGIFAAIFLFYTNSFIIKRRKKEFGLYNILGMAKKNIAVLMAIENLYIAVFTLALGLFFGILFSKLTVLLLLKILTLNVIFGFDISVSAVISTFILFSVIFTLTLLNNLRQVSISKPIELLYSGNTGEREPKTKWLLTLSGVICLGIGYYIAIVTESPLEAILLFFVAVILVIAGTYCLFTAGSITFLKLMRKNKNYYYKLRHFSSISGMIYRMKQNAVGLSNICILSTCVLVMVSTTLSLYIGIDDVVQNLYPQELIFYGNGITSQERNIIQSKLSAIIDVSKQKDLENYRYTQANYFKTGYNFTPTGSSFIDDGSAAVLLISASDMGMEIAEGEAYIYTSTGKYEYNMLNLGGKVYNITKVLDSIEISEYYTYDMQDVYYIITPDMDELTEWYYGFNYTPTNDEISLLKECIAELNNSRHSVNYNIRSERLTDYMSLIGGLLFLGIFLGVLFMMACILIIYYKQVSEGYDDKSRFEIMQKVGMSKSEVKDTIKSQVLTVFYLPLVCAVIHICFAFKMITRLLFVLALTDVLLFAICTAGTVLVFAVFYAIVYGITARSYYRIVGE